VLNEGRLRHRLATTCVSKLVDGLGFADALSASRGRSARRRCLACPIMAVSRARVRFWFGVTRGSATRGPVGLRAEDTVKLRPLGDLALKGFSRPVAVMYVHGLVSHQWRGVEAIPW
jgi:hypothetical protein